MFSIIASQLRVPDIDKLNHIYGTHIGIFSRTGETNPAGLYFRDDGKKFYVAGYTLDKVAEFDLYNPFDLSNITLKNTFSVNAQEGVPLGVFFKDDGTKMYVIGNSSDRVREYDLSTAWDISTASYNGVNFNTRSNDGNPQDIFFKPDGTRFYIVGNTNDKVYEYALSSAWDISTASLTQSFDISSQETFPSGIAFKTDGTIMYICGKEVDEINQYSLSTAWDVSTASFTNNVAVDTFDGNPEAIVFKSDGSVMYLLGRSKDSIQAFDLSTPWDTSTLSYQFPSKDYLDVSSVQNTPPGLTFKPDGTEMYVIGSQGDRVNQYTLSTPWDITSGGTPAQKHLPDSNFPSGIAFKPDGTKMFVTDPTNTDEDVDEYALSTPWDITTASYSQSLSVVSQDGGMQDVQFKPDGAKMFLVGQNNDSVYEYALSTAWDISTASFTTSFSVASQEGTPKGLVIEESGLKFYIIGTSTDRLHEYAMSTAWDLSTASFTKTPEKIKAMQLYELNPQGIYLKPDKTKMWMTGNFYDAVNGFSLI